MIAVIETRERPNMSLYGLERELVELLQYRDDVAGEVHVSPEGREEQKAALKTIDNEIAEYVKRQAVARADSVIAALRECKGRGEALKAEAKRLSLLAATQEERYEHIRKHAAEALAFDVEPAVIASATQGKVLRRVKGKLGDLKLCKSPGSVEVDVGSLLPAEMCTAVITMPLSVWSVMLKNAPAFVGDGEITQQFTPNKRAISEALKAGDSVPGARLLESNVHIRIT